MAARRDCSHFIPVLTPELTELLATDRGVAAEDADRLRRLATLIQEAYHAHFHRRLRELKDAYAPFDPDADAAPLVPPTAGQRQARLNDLLCDLNWVLDRAHFRHLSREEIEAALSGASAWGIRMRVDFSLFEHLAIFVRGEAHECRVLRDWRTLFRDREIDLPVFRRLVMIFKLRPNPGRLGPGASGEHVYLKLFKDTPRADVDMLVPGARVRLKLLDRGKIGCGMLSGLATLCWRLHKDLLNFVQTFKALGEATALGLTTGLLGYAYKWYFDYQTTRQAYHLNLTQSLYFQNLDGNAGVLTRLFDEAEEQQTRTALLAYFALWKYAGAEGFTGEELEAVMGLYLDRYAEVQLLCEPGEPGEQLTRLGLAEPAGDGRLRAVPLPRALDALRRRPDELSPP